MARAAFFHNALGKTDGVSLEVDKWRWCLERLGHQVFYCAGNNDAGNVHCVPELSFFHPVTERIIRNGTVALRDYPERELEAEIARQHATLKAALLRFIEEQRIDVLIPNNLLSVGYHLSALTALSEVIEETRLPTICHNHDFWFEKSGETRATCDVVRRLLETYAPPRFPNVQNLVINRLAQQALRERKNIQAVVVPNVFDFRQPAWRVDEYNSDFRQALGIGRYDLVFLQATRVMNRKGIELAVDLIAALQEPERLACLQRAPLFDGRRFPPDGRIVLLCAGYIEQFGATGNYHAALMERAQERGVDIRFIGERIKHSRATAGGRKFYSLWDSYVHADFVTYPSLWEGWGNQFIEAVFARLPVALFEYPVYTSDLSDNGFVVASLGRSIKGYDERGLAMVEQENLQRAADRALQLLQNPDERRTAVENNFNIGSQRYSYDVLTRIIEGLLDGCRRKAPAGRE